MPNPQLELINEFSTAVDANPVFCHQEFLEKLAAHGNDTIGRRAALLLQRLAVDERRLHYKTTQGVNRGWRRSRLGGTHGSHFYAWWAPRSAAPLKDGGFAEAPEGALFLRDIRHHDDHSPLAAHLLPDHYLPVSVVELRREEYSPAPWTPGQVRFASARDRVRLLKGHPGSGKTTALWHAADAAPAERILYVTYSRDLAALARGYFDRFCSSAKHFHVVTYATLLAELFGSGAPQPEAAEEGRKRFLYDVAPFARTLGPWVDDRVALYDELHAHLVGAATSVAAGRFHSCLAPRVSDKFYQDRRTRYVGAAAVSAALDAASRLEREASATLASRYFPALGAAWQAGSLLCQKKPPEIAARGFLDFDCIAVDECQDLTPVEAFVIVQLAVLIQQKRKLPPLVLIAGDEAQTVRPTDFEWGWLNDLLHARLATPAEFHLGANLRSPRRIAELVNRVWDLYGHIFKQERPSGTAAAEIDDDAPDQILCCTATPGEELAQLLTQLAAREGLALITLDDAPPDFVPQAVRSSVLTPEEVKGLDFNSVCVLDAGRHLERITRWESRWRIGSDIEALRKRLAIDRLRVALSRPSERIFWLDINPAERVVRDSLAFLNGGATDGAISSSVPGAILRSLEEEELDIEERIQRCQTDARQYLAVRPEIAWSRAQQAVTLLGRPGTSAAVADEAVRQSAYLTLAEICFALAFRGARLPGELGRPDLFGEAGNAAGMAGRRGLASVMAAIGRAQRALSPQERLEAIAHVAETLPRHNNEVEPWLRIEIGPKTGFWLEELESALQSGRNAAILRSILPPFYQALDIPDAAARIERLRQRAIQVLMKDQQYTEALAALRELPERQLKLEATCHEKLGDFRAAAECHTATGNWKEALNCYRSIPDFDAALALVRQAGDHPAAESLEWIARLRALVAERPEKFPKVVTMAEKKLLEDLLERSLGVARRKPAPRKPPAKRSVTARKKAAKGELGGS